MKTLRRTLYWVWACSVGVFVVAGAVLTVRNAILVWTGEVAGSPSPSHFVEQWEGYAADGIVFHGSLVRARLIVVEFSDLRCPACRMLAPRLDALARAYGNDVALVFRHFPINSFSFSLALAAECAADQGHFHDFRRAIFREQQHLHDQIDLDELSELVAVSDTPAFRKCMTDETFRWRVENDRAAALGLGVRGTPMVLVNGHLFHGVPDFDLLYEQARIALGSG